MMRQYFMTLPRELEDAAKLDGCGRLRFLWQVLLPLSKPIVASQALFAFIGNWNSYLWPLIVTTSERMRTLQIGLRYFVSQEGGTLWGVFMAATVFVSLPTVVFYLIVQKSFVEGIATTGIKGM
jgi:multiple sugar transport system permease protein